MKNSLKFQLFGVSMAFQTPSFLEIIHYSLKSQEVSLTWQKEEEEEEKKILNGASLTIQPNSGS